MQRRISLKIQSLLVVFALLHGTLEASPRRRALSVRFQMSLKRLEITSVPEMTSFVGSVTPSSR